MSTYLITGASRGIGLELTRQLVERDASEVAQVFALSRNQAPTELQNLLSSSSGRAVHVQADVTIQASVDKAVETVATALSRRGLGLDVLVNNAAIQWPSAGGISTMSVDQMETLFASNVCSVQRSTLAFLPLLRRGNDKIIVNISSTLGSITDAPLAAHVPTPAYKISKAALNMLTVQYALELDAEGFTVIAINPGNIKTDLGGKDGADLDLLTGVTALRELVCSVDRSQNGRFLNVRVPGWETKEPAHRYDGKDVAW